MKHNNFVFGFLLFITLIFSGCASYSPSLVKLDKFGPETVKQTEGDLCIYLEEYASEEKCEMAFDSNLYDEGVVPLLFMVENNGDNPYEVKMMDILVRDEVNMLKPLTPEEAASKAKRSAVGRAIGWSLIVPIVAIPVAAVASASDTKKVNTRIIHDFQTKGFEDGAVMPNKTLSGFLFFEVEEDREYSLADMNLEMTARNMDTGEIITIAAPLPDIMLEEEKQKASKKEEEKEKDPFTGR